MPNARFRAHLSKYKIKCGVGVWWVQPLGRYRLFLFSHKVLKCQLRNNIFYCVFIPIHHSFGFSDIFVEGILRPQRPLDLPPVMPVYTVDIPGFRAMIQALNPRYQLRTTLGLFCYFINVHMKIQESKYH